MSVRLLVRGGQVFDPAAGIEKPRAADVLIDGARIAQVIERRPDRPQSDPGDATILDATDRLVTPGFFNAHYHSHDVFLKGRFEPSPLELWVLNALPRSYPPRSPEEIRLRTLLGAVECLRNGITTIQDMVTLYPLDDARVDALVSAYEEVGVRVVLALQVADVPPLDTSPYWRETIPPEMLSLLDGAPIDRSRVPDPLDVIERRINDHSAHTDRIRWAIAPSSPERCSLPLLERLHRLAERYDLPVYSHIYISKAEAVNARQNFGRFGGSLVRVLEAAGLLNDRLSVVHGVWLDDDEIRRLADARASVVLNPVSNLKNKNGVAPIRALLEAGVNLALGCDNCSCTDVQSMHQAMKMMCLLAAVSDPRPGPPTAADALRAATLAGSHTAGLSAQVGRIAPGMRADLVLYDLADPAFVPLNDCARQLVYAESGRAIETVIVDGRVVMENRRILTINEATLRGHVNDAIEAFRVDADKVIANTNRLAPYLIEADRKVWAHELGFGRYIGRV